MHACICASYVCKYPQRPEEKKAVDPTNWSYGLNVTPESESHHSFLALSHFLKPCDSYI